MLEGAASENLTRGPSDAMREKGERSGALSSCDDPTFLPQSVDLHGASTINPSATVANLVKEFHPLGVAQPNDVFITY